MPRRVMQGKVVSDAPDKTVVVLVERRIMHPIYKKIIRLSITNSINLHYLFTNSNQITTKE